VGFLRDLGALDFAGGTVVHMASGFSALTACIICGPRRNVDLRSPPDGHNVPMFVLGTVILWYVNITDVCDQLCRHGGNSRNAVANRIGWFGFNGGSALAANDIAVQAMFNTQIASATAFTTWMLIDAITKRGVTVVWPHSVLRLFSTRHHSAT
jgi:Amt family ammonium transporter